MRPRSRASAGTAYPDTAASQPSSRHGIFRGQPIPPLVVEYPYVAKGRARRVAIGCFDGVHRGHAAIARGCDTVLTFDPHPRAVFCPEDPPKLLTSLPEKIELLAHLDVREVVVIRFDREVAAQTPEAFVEQTLLGDLRAVQVSVGANFRFGARAAGDTESLRARREFTTRVVELVRADGDVVSSTRIRRLVKAGDVKQAAELLGRPLRRVGRVMKPRRGDDPAVTELAFPAGYACPPPGRYVCVVHRRRAAGGGTVRPVEILPPAAAGGARARIEGCSPSPAERYRLVEFLEPDGIPSI